ncbi:MAG: replication-associated recombination protein A [Nitrospirae bacterium]|nr:replication-associated recombination protein A [Nitrospirota bacterium]
MDLFSRTTSDTAATPLAWRMRPRTLAEYVGQGHLLGPGKLIHRQLAAGRIGSLILFGPPGCGKTAMAHLIAAELGLPFEELNAVTAGIPDIRAIVERATVRRAATGAGTLLFIDEIHRFNKPQQSALLPHVEQGLITLIGASTQNPFFAIIPPLASRSHIVPLEPHAPEEIRLIVERALADRERGLGALTVQVAPEAMDFLVTRTEGDARRTLNTLDMAVTTTRPEPDGTIRVGLAAMAESLGRKPVVYEDGDAHYDTISAFIKSIRGSDPDAALYWLAKMIEGGEDPLFIARRLVISASEDVGNADPRALDLAMSAYGAVSAIGMPEGRIPLAQATTYLALAPKSNAAYKAVDAALADIRSGTVLAVPAHLRDSSYAGAKKLGHGKGYQYPHDFPDHYVAQDYLGAARSYYHPTRQGFEARLAERLAHFNAIKAQNRGASPPAT